MSKYFSIRGDGAMLVTADSREAKRFARIDGVWGKVHDLDLGIMHDGGADVDVFDKPSLCGLGFDAKPRRSDGHTSGQIVCCELRGVVLGRGDA